MWVLQLLSLGILFAHGDFQPPLARFARPLSMGDAFVGIAEGPEGLYYNPASMAGNPLFNLSYFDLGLETSGDTITTAQTASDAFKGFNASKLGLVMGKNFYAHGQFTPTLLMPGFGIGFITDHQVGLFLQNRALPEIKYGFQQTNGFVSAFGFSVLPQKKRRNKGSSQDLRVGVGLKMLWRRGGYHTLPISSLLQLSDRQNLVSRYLGNYGMGLGLDLGSQYIHTFQKGIEGSLGIAYTDVGNTAFSGGGQAQRGNLSVGAGFKRKLGKLFTGTFSSDVRNITNRMDWRGRTHFGAGVETPLFYANVGLSGLFLTYGASLNLWLIRISAASYGEELGEVKGDHSTRNYLLQLSMSFGF